MDNINYLAIIEYDKQMNLLNKLYNSRINELQLTKNMIEQRLKQNLLNKTSCINEIQTQPQTQDYVNSGSTNKNHSINNNNGIRKFLS